MPTVVYQDYPHAKLIILWGVNPSASGIHLIPFIKEAQAAGATLVVIDPRTTSLAKTRRPAPRGASGHRPAGRARAASRDVRRRARRPRRSSTRTPTAPIASGTPAAPWTIERAAAEAAIDPAALRRLADLYVRVVTRAGALRLGPRAQSQRRQRGGGGAGAAVRRRQVRRSRRRLLDEQLARLRPQDGRSGSTRPSRPRAS